VGEAGAATRRRYAMIGVGARSQMYQDAMQGLYQEHANLVALCDRNPGRLELARQRSRENGAFVPPGYKPEDLERMIAETKPEVIFVLSIDESHDDYIIRAMEAGCDVITEKPMTTSPEKCRRILETRARTGRSCRVTFNYRYSPPRTQVKDILMSGEIGDVLSVDFHWMLDTIHGADYFRRWHGYKENSGGLMVHKATHHFDLVNWWLSAMPVTVTATGKRQYYTPEMAKRMGLSSYHERCHTCPETSKCSFFLDMEGKPSLKRLYLEQEEHDGYQRDLCVFRPDLEIEDTMNVIVGYDTGATLCYSLNTFNAWEGYTIAFNGTKGRLEHTMVEQIYISGSGGVQGGIKEGGITLRMIPMRGPAHEIEPWKAEGGHGGGDIVLLRDLFLPNAPFDKYQRAADHRAGASSILVGLAANRCFETGKTTAISELVPHLERPDFAPMPSATAPIPMPPATTILSG